MKVISFKINFFLNIFLVSNQIFSKYSKGWYHFKTFLWTTFVLVLYLIYLKIYYIFLPHPMVYKKFYGYFQLDFIVIEFLLIYLHTYYLSIYGYIKVWFSCYWVSNISFVYTQTIKIINFHFWFKIFQILFLNPFFI